MRTVGEVIIYCSIALVLLSYFIILLSYLRAKANKPYYYKRGMKFCHKTNKVIPSKAEIMTDPLTGEQYVGKITYKK